MTMLTAPIKLGIAVVCLLAVAGLIAMDLKKNDGGDGAKANPPQPLVTPVVAAYPPAAPPAPAPVEKVGVPEEKKPTVVAKEEPKEPATPPVVKSEPELRIYTVVQGDTLYGISIKVYGTPRHYQKIYELNRDRIADPNRLQIGINLKMPEVPLAPAVGHGGPTSPEVLAVAGETD